MAHDNTVNDTRFADFMKRVANFAKKDGAGKDALIDMALDAVQMAADGVITSDKDTKVQYNGAEMSHATYIYTRYTEESSKKDTHSVGGISAHASELNQLIQVGELATTGSFTRQVTKTDDETGEEYDEVTDGDPVILFNDALERRKALAAKDCKVLPAWKALVAVARKQLATSRVEQLTTQQIDEAVAKPDREPKELKEKIADAYATTYKLVSQAADDGDAQAALVDAQEAFERALNAMGIDPNDHNGVNDAKAKAKKATGKKVAALVAKGLSRDDILALLTETVG